MDTVVIGAGPAGMATALAVAAAGHRVVVLERDSPPPPGPAGRAGAAWRRAGLPQRVHGHVLTSLGVALLREHAPELLARLITAEASLLDLTTAMPAQPVDVPVPDGELVALACRRTTLEVVLHRYAVAHVPIRYRTRVRAVEVRAGRAVGVRTQDGARLAADLVVDASGAHSRDPLTGQRARYPESVPTGMRGLSRFYRRTGPPGPLNRGNAAGLLTDELTAVLHPGDGDTFSVVLGYPPECPVPRDPAQFDRVARGVPGINDWLAGSEIPISGVSLLDLPDIALRPAVCLPGLVRVGDAACVTNPVFGRGVSLALAQGFRIGAALAAGAPDPDAVFAEDAERLHRPWYRQSADEALDRIARLAGDPGPPTTALPLSVLGAAARSDSLVWRETTRMLMTLRTPTDLAADPVLTARLAALSAP